MAFCAKNRAGRIGFVAGDDDGFIEDYFFRSATGGAFQGALEIRGVFRRIPFAAFIFDHLFLSSSMVSPPALVLANLSHASADQEERDCAEDNDEPDSSPICGKDDHCSSRKKAQ
jgi:hypothetical protein